MCYLLAQRIYEEAEQLKAEGMSQTPENVKAVIQKPRPDCPEWMEWTPWLSPEEHRRMKHSQFVRLREDKRDREARHFRIAELVLTFLTVAALVVGIVFQARATRALSQVQTQITTTPIQSTSGTGVTPP
jgi:hypothetical protein